MSAVVISSDEEDVSSPPAKKFKGDNSVKKIENENSESNLFENDVVEEVPSPELSKVEPNHVERKEKTDPDNQNFSDSEEIQELIQLCISKIGNYEEIKTKFLSKIKLLKKMYRAIEKDFFKSEEFKHELQIKIDLSKRSDLPEALRAFREVFCMLKDQTKRSDNGLEKNYQIAIRKMEKCLKKLQKRIAILETAEVDFEEEENSNYMKMQRYRERATQVYLKLCKYKKENPNSARMSHRRLDFSDSQYGDINIAINKKYRTGEKFPDYRAFVKVVSTCAKNKNLNLSDAEIELEAKLCFEKLGNLLQKRRQIDLFETHCEYISSSVDPASEDSVLNEALKTNQRDGESKLASIIQKYAKLQETGVDKNDVSSESDDSNYQSSDEENGV